MRVLFVYTTDWIDLRTYKLLGLQYSYLGISYLSSHLKYTGHQTDLLLLSKILSKKTTFKLITEKLNSSKPDLICFTCVATEYPYNSLIANFIKTNHPEIPLIIGGPHVSLSSDEAIRDCFNYICIGEGEFSLSELCTCLTNSNEPLDIPNLIIKHDGKINANPVRPFNCDLDSLPFPDRELWNNVIDYDKSQSIPVLLGRGCPFLCTYCSNHALMKLAEGKYVRLRSVENILMELKELINSYPNLINYYLEVETFGIDKKWAFELCDALAALNSSIPNPRTFGTNLRITPRTSYEDLFGAMKRANFEYINIGLESGSDRVRREILNRKYSNDDVLSAIRLAQNAGLRVNIYNLIGLPGETWNEFKETVEFNKKAQPATSLHSIFYPYPGTKLFDVCKNMGLLEKRIETDKERLSPVLDMPGFSKSQIMKAYLWFDYYIYKGIKPLPELLISYLRRKINTFHYYNNLRRLTLTSFLINVLRRKFRK
ncbi:MAG: B12-binding protein [Ignavibacteria bacterium]|nr:B12-binding protein [Ignavibacteria bacterium]